jgi:hypothetical protein
MFCKSLMKHLKGFGSGFTKLHTKLYADTSLGFAIHRRQNETQSQKRTHVKTTPVHSVVSCGGLMQQAFRSVTLGSPLIFFHLGSYNNSPGTFRYHLVLVCIAPQRPSPYSQNPATSPCYELLHIFTHYCRTYLFRIINAKETVHF